MFIKKWKIFLKPYNIKKSLLNYIVSCKIPISKLLQKLHYKLINDHNSDKTGNNHYNTYLKHHKYITNFSKKIHKNHELLNVILAWFILNYKKNKRLYNNYSRFNKLKSNYSVKKASRLLKHVKQLQWYMLH